MSWALASEEVVEEFGNRALHETAIVSKSFINNYYGKPPHHAYFSGCSDGGREFARSSRDHQPRCRLAHQKASEAPNPPATLKVLRPKIEDIASLVCANIEDNDGRRSYAVVDRRKEIRDASGLGYVARMETHRLQLIPLRKRVKPLSAPRGTNYF